MIGLNAGTAHVRVRPDLREFHKVIKRDLSGLDKVVSDQVSKGVRDSTKGIKPTMVKVDADTAKARAEIQKLEKALRDSEAAQLKAADRLSAAKQKEADAIGQVRVAEKRLGEVRDSNRAKASQLAAAEERLAKAQRGLDLARKSVRQDTAEIQASNREITSATRRLEALRLEAERVDGKNVNIRVKTRGANQATSLLQQTSLTMGQMVVGATALGSALIPVAAGVAAVGAALSAPLAAAGGGLTLFGIIAGVAVKRTKDQIKEIDDLQEKAVEARDAIAGTTGAARKAAIKEAAEATRAYKQALNQLSPAQERFMNAQARMSGAFDKLMKRAGPAIFGPLIQGMNLLTRVLPRVQPILKAVAEALGGVLRGIGRAVDSREFQNFANFFTAWIGPAIRSFAKILGNITVGVVGLIKAFAPLGGSVLRTLVRVTGAFADFGRTATSNAGVQGFIDYVRRIGPAVLDFFRELVGAVVNLVQAFAPIGGVVLAGLTRVFHAIRSIPIDVLTSGLSALVGGLAAYKLATIGARIATAVYAAGTTAATGATWSLNAALRANPIGLVVTALGLLVGGLILAYRKSETFREIVDGAWRGIKRAAAAAWDVIKPILVGLRDFLRDKVVPIIQWWWHNVTVPAFRAIGAIVKTWWKVWVRPIFRAVSWFIENVLAPVFRWIRDKIQAWFGDAFRIIRRWWNQNVKPVLQAVKRYIENTLGPAIERLHSKVIKPTFNRIQKFIQRWWESGVKPTFRTFTWHIRNVMAPTIKWLYEKTVKPRFKLMGWVIEKWWTAVRAVFRAVNGFIRNTLAPVIRWLYEKGVKPTFRAIGQHISYTWNQKIKPVFRTLGGFIRNTVAPAFRRGVDAIGNAWDTLKRLAASPVNFVINRVYNDGLRKFVNSVLEKFPGDAPKLPHVRPITTGPMHGGRSTGRRPGLQRFAEGGVLPGYTPGVDVHHFVSPTGGRLDLSGGEAIMRPEWTRAVGKQRIAQWNRDALHGRLGQRLPRRRFARGGVNPVPSGVTNPHGRNYYGADWAGDFAVPIGTPVKAYREGRVAFTRRMSTSYGNHIGLNHPGGVSTLYAHLSSILVRAGQAVRAAQVIGKSGSTGNSTGPHLHFEIDGAPFAAGGDTGGGGLLNWVGRLAAKAVGKLTGPIMGLLDKVPGADTPFGHIVTGAGKSAITSVADWVQDKFGGTTGDTGPIPKGPVVQIAKQLAAQRYGWTGRQWTALRELVMRESSWNPNAQNPTSSAYGLFQFLDSTWAGVGGRKTSDPGKQIVYGLRYISQRYGSPLGALNFHDRNNWYDNGGWLNPGQWGVNRSRKPEPVFSNQQWQILKRAITSLTMNQGRPINASWLRRLTRDVPKTAEQLRREFLKLRDAMRGYRVRTERTRRRLRRLRATDRFERRSEEAREAERAFEATRSGEAIGEDVSEARRDRRRALRRARRSPIGRDALRDYRKASRELEKQRDIETVEAAERRTKWRRQEARERLRNERAGIIQARGDLRKARTALDKADTKAEKKRARERVEEARRDLRRARQQPDSVREAQARKEVKRTTERLKKLGKERDEIEKLTKQRDRAGRQSEAVRDLARATKRLEALRAERKERQRLRREARRAGRADILKREERLQERLNKRIDAEKKARDAAKKAAQAYRAAQQAAIERARTLTTAGIELGGIGAASFKTSGGILSNLRRAVRSVTEWGQVVKALIGRGLRGPILEEFIDAGPSAEAVRLGKSLLTGGKIAEINTLQDQLRLASTNAAAVASASYTPAQRAAIRRATPVKYQPGQVASNERGVTIQYTGMPADTVDTIVNKTTARVRYELNRGVT